MFKIGDFAQFSRVSVKMLRHYAEIGLLIPAHIEVHTGYRYYMAAQLPRLNRIIALKDLGFSLEQIGRILNDDLPAEQLRGMLRLRQAEIEERLRAEEIRLASVEARLRLIEQEDARPHYDVVLRAIAAETVACLRADVFPADDDAVSTLFDAVERFASEHKARAPRPPLMFWHGRTAAAVLDVEVAVPLTRPLEPAGSRVRVRQLAAVPQVACLIHTGSYTTLDAARQSLYQWAADHYYAASGPLREVFLRFGADTTQYPLPPEYLAHTAADFVTELQLPVSSEQ